MSYDTSRPVPFAVGLPAAAFTGVRTRRFAAFCVDFTIVSVLAFLLSGVAFFYNGSSVSGPRMATPGMRMFDIELRTIDGFRPSFLAAALHGVMLYLSWMFPPVFLASLVTPDKRCLHDILAGLVAVRRPD